MSLTELNVDVCNSMCDAFVDAIDGGTGSVNGAIEFFTSGFALQLATTYFSSPAFGDAVSRVATANDISPDTDAEAGTNAVAQIVDTDGTVICKLTCGLEGSGEDIEFNKVAWDDGDYIYISSATVEQPQSA